MSVPGLSALGIDIVLEDTYNAAPSQMSDVTPTQMDDDEDMEDEDSSNFSDDENVSINNLI